MEIDTGVVSVKNVLEYFNANNTIEDLTIEDPSMEQVIAYINRNPARKPTPLVVG